MNSAVTLEAKAAPGRLRLVDPRRDMAQVAELVEGVFRNTLDESARQMLTQMRTLGRAGWIGWLVGTWLLPAAIHLQGCVWIEGRRVIGNAGLVPVDGFPGRWVLANVAVHPDYRCRGIGRQLVRASVERAQNLGARELLLQVKHSDTDVQELYRVEGFLPLAIRTTWTRPPGALPKDRRPESRVRGRLPEEWKAQWELASRLYPEGLVWPFPLQPNLFQPPRLVDALSIDASKHWVWSEEGYLLGSLTAQRLSERVGWRLILMVDSSLRGQGEVALVSAALVELGGQRYPVVLDYPSGMAEGELASLGFGVRKDLMWMVRHMASAGCARAESEQAPQLAEELHSNSNRHEGRLHPSGR